MRWVEIKLELWMDVLLLAVGLGCIWHGAQIVWAAPTPSQFRKQKPDVEPGSEQAFRVFWLDQYAWTGIGLIVVGLGLSALGI